MLTVCMLTFCCLTLAFSSKYKGLNLTSCVQDALKKNTVQRTDRFYLVVWPSLWRHLQNKLNNDFPARVEDLIKASFHPFHGLVFWWVMNFKVLWLGSHKTDQKFPFETNKLEVIISEIPFFKSFPIVQRHPNKEQWNKWHQNQDKIKMFVSFEFQFASRRTTSTEKNTSGLYTA